MGKRSPERETTILLATHAGKELYGRCSDCGGARRFAIAPLARKYGKQMHIAELSYRLRCPQCGRKGIPLQLLNWDQADPDDFLPY